MWDAPKVLEIVGVPFWDIKNKVTIEALDGHVHTGLLSRVSIVQQLKSNN